MSVGEQVLHTALRVHDAIYKRTDGRVGHRLLGVPTLLLHTTGRRSGERRSNSLLYIEDGGRYVVVASKGGADAAPGWLHNVRANPQVEVQVGRTRRRATATVIRKDHPDFARLWAAANKANGGRYDEYQRKTARRIPLVVLTPEG